jgi:LPS-assembly lipoprotein
MSVRIVLLRLVTTVTVVSLLSGCGFALRGSVPAAALAGTVQLLPADPPSALTGTVREVLQSSGITVQVLAGEWQLQVGPESIVSRPGSVNSRARASQYDVEMSVEIALTRGDSTAFGPLRIATQRSYYEDLSTIAGSSEEVVLLQQEMRQELAQQVLRRLRAALAEQGA